MKKVITVILTVALLAALALPAVADAFTLYASQGGVKVYAKKDTGSKVYRKLSRGEKVLIEKKSGKWYAILVEDPSGDGQTLGWIQAKYLSTTKPSKKKKATPAPKATVSPQREINRVLDTMRDVDPYDAEVVTKTEKGTVALRRQPTTGGKLILHLMNGARVRVLAEGQEWFEVIDPDSGNTGYMASKYIVRLADVAGGEKVDGAEIAPVESGDDYDDETDDEAGAPGAGPRTVTPIASTLDVNRLPDGEYPVAFDRGDVARLASGTYMNAVRVYAMDVYAADEIDALAAGDTVVVEGQAIAVASVTRTEDDVSVNGGMGTVDGCQFTRTEEGDYRVDQENDLPTYTELGVTTLVVDESAEYTDSADIDSDPVTADYDGLVEAMQGAAFSDFYANNTTVTIRDGRVVRIARTYVP